jgi:hypothetical protein
VRIGDSFHYPVLSLATNPEDYTLTTPDGVRYRYNQFTGLEQVTDRNGNTLTRTAAGITSSAGASVEFLRDSQDDCSNSRPGRNAIRYLPTRMAILYR